jgi:mono/diheme cytochrome c family protein
VRRWLVAAIALALCALGIPAAIRAQIENGSQNKNMPAFRSALTDAQIEALIAYVKSLK